MHKFSGDLQNSLQINPCHYSTNTKVDGWSVADNSTGCSTKQTEESDELISSSKTVGAMVPLRSVIFFQSFINEAPWSVFIKLLELLSRLLLSVKKILSQKLSLKVSYQESVSTHFN